MTRATRAVRRETATYGSVGARRCNPSGPPDPFGREKVPCLLLDQRFHLTEPGVAAPALICGGARCTPCAPGRRSFVARWREVYAVYARLTIVRGPAAQDVARAPATGGRRWPGGASRTGDRRSHHPNPHLAPTDATSHPACLVRSSRKWCEVDQGRSIRGCATRGRASGAAHMVRVAESAQLT